MVEAIALPAERAGDTGDERVDLRQHSYAILEPLIVVGVTCCQIHLARKQRKCTFPPPISAREALGTNWLKLEIHPTPAGCCRFHRAPKPPKRWYNRDLSCRLTAGRIRIV
ncbi:hypothetical protein ACLK1S_24830 [Escherichia coli]